MSLVAGMTQFALVTEMLRARMGLGIVLSLAFVGVFYSFRNSAARKRLAGGGRALIAAALVPLVFLLVQRPPLDGTWQFQLLSSVNIWLLGWSLYLLATSSDDDRRVPLPGLLRLPARVTRTQLALMVVAIALLVLSISKFSSAGRANVIIDDALYLFQSRLFGQDHFSLQFDPDLKQFFMVRLSAFRNGGMFTQYPPGWPAVIHLFDSVGLSWWAGPTIRASCVLLTYLLGEALYSRAVGLMAAAMLLLDTRVIISSNANAAAGLFLLLAAWLTLRDRTGNPKASVRWLAVGMSLGAVFAIRPLSGATAGFSIALWYIFSQRPSARLTLWIALRVIAGAAVPFIATLLYNQATTGHALTFGYTAAAGELGSLGFGSRGLVAYAADGTPLPMAREFSLLTALRQQGRPLWQACMTLLPSGLLVPFLFVAVRRGARINWKLIAAFLPFPMAYFFWQWSDIRFFVEILPFVFIGIAVVFDQFRREKPLLARTLAIYMMLVVPMVASARLYLWRKGHQPCRVVHAQVAEYAEGRNLLLFVQAGPAKLRESLLECIYAENAPAFSGPIVAARDVGEGNSVLIKKFPDREPVHLRWDPRSGKGVFEPLPR